MRNNLQWIKGGNREGKPGYYLIFDFDQDIIDRIKETIPASLREWDPDNKRWWVSELAEKQVNDIFRGFLEAVISQKQLF